VADKHPYMMTVVWPLKGGAGWGRKEF